MNKCLIIFLLLVVNHTVYGQEQVKKLIDSLNRTSDTETRVELSKQIASELKYIDWPRTLTYIEIAENEVKSLSDLNLLASVYVSVAEIYYDKDVVDVSLEYYLKAYKIYKAEGNLAEQISLQNNLAIIYARINNVEKATHFFNNIFQYHNNFKSRDSLQYATILNNLGTLYLDKNVDSSLVYYKRALKINSRLNSDMLYAYLYTNLARALYAKDSTLIDEASIYYEKALKVANKVEDKEIKSVVYGYVSEFYLKENKNDSAIYYAKKAANELKENKYSFNNQDIIQTIYKAYINKEKYKEAASYFELYNEIRDSIHLERQAVNVERLKLQEEYKSRLKIRELADEKRRFKYLLILFVLLSGVLGLLLLLFKYRNKIAYNRVEKKLLVAKKQELEYNLSKKNRALVSKAMIEVQKASASKQVLKDLKQLRLKIDKKEPQEFVGQVIRKLQREINSNIWKEFEFSFEQVHKSFYKNLYEKHPDLSPKDRRLCTLLFLDLTSKEISQITGQSFKAIENSRTRLRKKLELTNVKINISTYLRSFV